MKPTEIYTIGAGSLFALLLLTRSSLYLQGQARRCRGFFRKHIFHPYILKRHRFFGPWTRAQVLAYISYLTVNIVCGIIDASSIEEVGSRASVLSLVNMIPSFFSFHLSFVGDVLGISLLTCRRMHAFTGVTCVLLGLFHVLVSVASVPNLDIFQPSGQLFGLITVLTTTMLIVFTLRVFRLPSYEVFLRGHQAAAFTAAYALWKHAGAKPEPTGLYLYIALRVFLAATTLQAILIIYRNFSLSRGISQALISKQHGVIKMTIRVPRLLKVKARQYVNVWIPSISFWSFLQSHPFTIVSWSEEGGTTSLDLMIEPRAGLTQRIFACVKEVHLGNTVSRDRSSFDLKATFRARTGHLDEALEDSSAYPGDTLVDARERRPAYLSGKDTKSSWGRSFGFSDYDGEPLASDFRTALISGPHGTGLSAGDYGKVLMIATGFGIAAQLPHLKELVEGFHTCQVRTREIRLVWQIENIDDRRPASELIDRALKKDTATNGYIFHIEVYYKVGDVAGNPLTVGEHGRLTYRNGTVNIPELLEAHAYSRVGRTLVTVSANEQVRDEVHSLILPYLENVTLVELDYQPAKKQRFWSTITKRRTVV